MTDSTFRALVITEHPEKAFKRTIDERRSSDLPEGEVLVRVHYSSLNYKDGLSSIGNRGVTRKYPHTPGIDASGIVESSASDAFKSGDEVIVTSYDLGMNTSGGYGQYIRVPQWIGAVDTVGGATLATLLKSLDRGGAAAATGLVASPDLPTSVFPFILRGVSLLGIDSGETPMALRQAIWGRLAGDWKLPQLNALMVDCTLDTLGPEIDKILKGQQRGRVVVDLES